MCLTGFYPDEPTKTGLDYMKSSPCDNCFFQMRPSEGLSGPAGSPDEGKPSHRVVALIEPSWKDNSVDLRRNHNAAIKAGTARVEAFQAEKPSDHTFLISTSAQPGELPHLGDVLPCDRACLLCTFR